MFLFTVKVFVIVCFMAIAYQVASTVDGILFPVISITSVEKVEQLPDSGGSRVKLHWLKNRQCDRIRTEWFIGRPGRSISTTSEPITPITAAASRGDTGVADRLIHMSKTNFLENSYAIATHDCYKGFLWQTRTLIWDSARDGVESAG